MAKSYPSNQESVVNPHEYEDLSGSPVVEYPDPEEHERLMTSPDARAERRAQRLGALPVDFANTPAAPRGKRRPEFEGGGRFPFEFLDRIPDETVITLARAIQAKQPIFDKFTDHYKVDPNKDSIDTYIMAANKKRVTKPNPSMPADERQKVMDKMRRQTQAVADNLQQSLFTDRNIARLRRFAVKAVRYQIGNGLPLDVEAVANAGDAVEDFGHGLQANPNILRRLGDMDLGVQIVHIGQMMSHQDSEFLKQNALLLRLVQIEQKAREDYWRVRFEASQKYTNGRLTKRDKQNHRELEADVERFEAICKSQ